MQVRWEEPRERIGALQIYGALGLLALAVARWVPIARLLAPVWGCAFRKVTGIPCLACGLTRAFDYTTHGRIGDAFRVTPLGALLPWVCALGALWAVLTALGLGAIPVVSMTTREARWTRVSVVVSVIANWVYMVGHQLR